MKVRLHEKMLDDAILTQVVEVYRAMSKEADRPLRVLDIGCAPGALACRLTALGAYVTCAASPESIVGDLKCDEYDLVVALTLEAAPFVMYLGDRVAGVVAITSTYDQQFMNSYCFSRLLNFPAHDAHNEPLLFFASSRLWYFPQSMARFDTWTQDSQPFIGKRLEKTRWYYMNATHIAKRYILQGGGGLQKLSRYRSRTEVSYRLSPCFTECSAFTLERYQRF